MGRINQLKKIATDPRWWSFYVQRRFMSPGRRNRLADFIARFRPKMESIDPKAAKIGLESLHGAGIHSLGQLLTSEQCAELLDYFKSKQVKDPYRSEHAAFLPLSGGRHPEGHIAHHDGADIANAPYLMNLANDPRILNIVGAFLGCKPTIGYMASWWSYPTSSGAQQAENYHRDVDDWRFIKLFVYLTDVGLESGPHKYVSYSAGKPLLSETRRFDDEEVANAFGKENILTMTSNAGEGFLEDTFGIHKGQPVKEGHRLLFQVVYTLAPLPYAPAKPVVETSETETYDPWINRVYLG